MLTINYYYYFILGRKSFAAFERESNENDNLKFTRSWSHSVKGVASTNNIIDPIAIQPDNDDNIIKTITTNKKNQISSDDDEEADDDALSHSSFIDNEAFEVNESDESMDPEERQYLQENEIIEQGESLGSEDTEPEQKDSSGILSSFIVSDNDDADSELLDGSGDDLCDLVSQRRKSNSRIVLNSSSDESIENQSNDNTIQMIQNSIKSKKKDKYLSKSFCSDTKSSNDDHQSKANKSFGEINKVVREPFDKNQYLNKKNSENSYESSINTSTDNASQNKSKSLNVSNEEMAMDSSCTDKENNQSADSHKNLEIQPNSPNKKGADYLIIN